MNGLLLLENITAGYGNREVVRDIRLEIGRGEFCALLGLNGSGKTTLFKALCGLIPTQAGSCLVNGLDCTRFHERKRARYISYIPQRHSKMQGVTVRDVALMGCNPHLPFLGSPTLGDRERAEGILTKMGLRDLAERDFAQLSEGQKQLVILSRTLVQNAPVMLMDEPDSALDFPNRHMVLSKMRELIHREGKAGLITLHDPNSALAYCDRIILLKNGGIVGRLELAGASKGTISIQLSKIYGNIDVVEHNGRFIVTLR